MACETRVPEMSLGPGELPACLAGLGMDCFTSPEAPRLRGQIKRRPDDFIVTELDGAGHAVVLNGAGSSDQTEAMAEAPLGGGGPCTDLQQSTAQHDQAATNSPSYVEAVLCDHQGPEHAMTPHQGPEHTMTPHLSEGADHTPQLHIGPDHTPRLCELVSDETYQQVVSMATKCSTTPSAESASSLSLGVVDDKAWRTALHRAVRLAFPVLNTATHRTDSGQQEVRVAMDANYPRLRDLLGHEEAAKLGHPAELRVRGHCGSTHSP